MSKSPEMNELLENFSNKFFGRSRLLSKAGNQCVSCGKPAVDFRDEKSRKEYNISMLCQSCQDSIFGK